ncbi:MAG: indole-3-glycerol phosphate synthase TrpC [Hyphomicrobium sp.]
MSSFLEKITEYKIKEVKSSSEKLPLHILAEYARSAPPVRSFENSIRKVLATNKIALIAEIKKASPSKGLIRSDFDPSSLALGYEQGGATCLSVLTDTPSFQGSPEDIMKVRNVVTLPILRKDFMVDPYQVVEARAWGADCILIIMAAVDDALASELETAAKDWKMDVIVEVHNEDELKRSLKLETRLIGINNRNLITFETTLKTTEALAPLVPKDRIVISESGIFTSSDIHRLRKIDVNTFLVGESLMRQPDVTKAVVNLLS